MTKSYTGAIMRYRVHAKNPAGEVVSWETEALSPNHARDGASRSGFTVVSVAPAGAARTTAELSALPRRKGMPFWVMALAVVALVVPVMLVLLALAINRAKESDGRLRCANNMRKIGVALSAFAEQHDSRLPSGFDSIGRGYGLTQKSLVCPVDPTSAYVYGAGGLNRKMLRGSEVLVCEPLGPHGTGINVLRADGSSAFVADEPARKIAEAGGRGTIAYVDQQ